MVDSSDPETLNKDVRITSSIAQRILLATRADTIATTLLGLQRGMGKVFVVVVTRTWMLLNAGGLSQAETITITMIQEKITETEVTNMTDIMMIESQEDTIATVAVRKE
mmetsp:Transcript_14964/g.43154  ORF Transcript_14964/g.43154 Transcript_14964/m.43154 type:complete len:109 (+) Transcript_14964:1234-1560(+)